MKQSGGVPGSEFVNLLTKMVYRARTESMYEKPSKAWLLTVGRFVGASPLPELAVDKIMGFPSYNN